jgi:ABC-type multidrug transport system fused ATPase/permease subunit
MAFFIDVPSALIFAVTIPALGIVIAAVMAATVPIYRRVQSRLEGVLGKTRENLTGARVIRAFCREEDEIKDFDARNTALTKIQKLAGGISGLLNPVTFVMVNIAVILLIRTGALRVNSGELSQGEVVALYNYTAQILVELIKTASLIINLTKSIASGNRIQAVLEGYTGEPANLVNSAADNMCADKDSDSGYAVEFRGVFMRYPGASANSLEGVNISVKRGETIGVIGGTGSGKTTLVNLIPRLYDATEGEVKVDGKNVRTYTPEKLRIKIGIVPQKASLFRGSIRENLKLGCDAASDSELLDSARLAQAADVIEKKGGLDGVIEEGGRNLSGGQRLRLTIARALVRKPEILILDDSSSALDYATDAALRRSLHSLEWKPAVFIVSQRTSSVRQADRIIVLDDGRVAGVGSDRELYDNCPVYHEICESQRERRSAGNE